MKGMGLLAGCVLTALMPDVARAEVPASAVDSNERRMYAILSQDLASVLEEFGLSVGTPIVIDEAVEGRVENLKGAMTPREFLDRLARERALVWYYDGTAIHVTPASANRSVMIDFDQVTPELLEETFASLGLADDRFAIRSTGDGGVGLLTGPPRYVELAESAFSLLEERTLAAAPAPGDPAQPPVQVPVARRSDILIVRGDSAQVWRGRNALGEPAGGPDPSGAAKPEASPAPDAQDEPGD